MKDALDITHEITKLIKNHPHETDVLKRSTPGVRVLCPTRWTVRAEALQSI